MNRVFTACGHFAVMVALVFLCGAAEEPVRRSEAPKNLLQEQGGWQVQTGEWQLNGGAATATAGETLAELSANRAARLVGRWLSIKLTVTGDNAKAGLWFGGLRDARGEITRLLLEAATGDLTNGRGKVLAPLGDIQPAVELLLRFDPDKVSIFRAGNTVAEVPVTYSEAEATISIFAERGTARFHEILLSAVPTEAERMAPPVAPDPPKRGRGVIAPIAADARVTLAFPAAQPMALKSGWNDYFGLHSVTDGGPWKAVRQFDGPGFGFPLRDRHTGDVKTFDGPFSKTQVQVALADFRDWKRKEARGFDENLKTLIETDTAGLFIAPWAAPFTLIQQDHVWATMKLVYGANVGAEERVFFQWGDDINHRRLGVVPNAKTIGFEPRGGTSAPRGSNAPADASAYAENYFAPAVEAVRRASEEIFRDPRHIPILLGSCSRASAVENREWYARVLDHQLAGTNAQSLRGRKVIELVDYLTVNYPFLGAHDASALQDLWDRYGAKVKGLWVTEEYGPTTRSVGAFLERIALYLEWAARNQLDARQTRLFWNLPDQKRDAQNLTELARRLGVTFTAAPLDIAKEASASGTIYRIRSGQALTLFIHVPASERRGRKAAPVNELALDEPPGMAGRAWEARFIHTKERLDDANGVILPVDRKDGKLVIPVEATSRDAWALLLKAADAPGGSL
jgi:hypothetical protein